MAWRRPVPALATVFLLIASGCSGGGDDDTPNAIDQRLERLASAGVYIGGVAFTNTLVAIHYDGQGKPSPGMRM